MSDATETTGPTDAPVRSTSSVLLLLAGLVAVPVLVLLLIFGLRGAGSSGVGAELHAAIDEDRIQAVYMVSDEVFFGRIRDGEGAVFALHDAHFLRRTEAAGEDDEAPQPSLNLVSVAQDVDGDGTLVINASEVLRVQNLAADADIAKSIEDATK